MKISLDIIRRQTTVNTWQVAAFVGAQMLALGALADPAPDQSTSDIDSLRKQIQALTQKVDELELKQGAATEKQKAAPLVTAGENGFSMQSADSNFVLRLSGFGQVDGHYYASPAVGAKDTFTIRRLRAIASGTVYHDYDYYMQVDFASGITSTTTNNAFLQDAYLNIHPWKALQVQAGKFKEPVSLEWQPLDQYLWFLERGFPSELTPNRDVGAEIHGELWNGALTYQAGAFNGVPDGGSGDVEVGDNDKDAVTRVITAPFRNTQFDSLRNLAFGIGSSYGIQAGTTTPTFATVGRQTFFKYNSTVSEGGEHLRLDPQAYYYSGPFCAYWEYAFSDEKFVLPSKNSAANFQNSGWNVDASWFLTGESNIFGVLPVIPSPFHFDGSGWGAFQVAARFGQLSLDPAAFPLYAATGSAHGATSWSLALNWYLNHNVKCVFEYSQTAFSGGSKAAGALTAQDEKAWLARLQFGF